MPRSSPRPASGKPLGPLYFSPGHRRRLAEAVLSQAPKTFGRYFEPFLGGGVVAIALMERFADATFHLSSEDPDIEITWQALAADVDTVVALVNKHITQHSKRHVAEVGSAELSPAERAARFVYLRGAVGRERVAFDESNARRLAALLNERDVHFTTRPFFSIVSQVAEADFVFLDPPFGSSQSVDVDEVRSLVGTVTARGGYVVARGSAPYAAWNTMTSADQSDDAEPLSLNRTLERAFRRRP